MNFSTKNLFILLLLLFTFSCGRYIGNKPDYKAKPDNLFVTYPKYRIDDKIQKIGIMGTGPGQSMISSQITQFFLERSNIKVLKSCTF